MPPKFVSLFLLLLLTVTLPHTYARHHHHHKVRHHHNNNHQHQKHRLKSLDSNELNEIREAFDDYRKSVQIRDQISDEMLRANSLNDEEETVPAQSFQHNSMAMQRHKRVHSTTKVTTTTSKSIDNYDDEYEDDENETNRRVNDEAKVQSAPAAAATSVVNQPSQNSNAGKTLTDYKIANLGTRDSVDRTFKQHLRTNYQSQYNEYIRNLKRTMMDGYCRWPSKKAIEMPQHPSKIYAPRKYIIHQCSDDTSCCGSGEKTCVAKHSTNVTLWFEVRFANNSSTYESFQVQNHTECRCIYKSQFLPRTSRSSIATPSYRVDPRCRCVQEFSAVTTSRGCECRCDNFECRTRFEGKEKFSLSDRICISKGNCMQPNCQVGIYNSETGECPSRNERLKRHFSHHKFIS